MAAKIPTSPDESNFPTMRHILMIVSVWLADIND
jgi:hypothetical protein